MGFVRNALIYLGFVEDEFRDEMDSYGEPVRRQDRSYDERYERSYEERDRYAEPTRRYAEPEGYGYDEREARQRREPRPSRDPRRSDQMASVHPIQPRAAGQVHIVRPESYGDAQQIGDRMRSGLPVIVNLEEAESELARRIVAFASGLVYGLDGNLQKLSRRIYLVTPAAMEVSSEDKRRLSEESGLGF